MKEVEEEVEKGREAVFVMRVLACICEYINVIVAAVRGVCVTMC